MQKIIKGDSGVDTFLLTPNQKRIWFLEMLNPDTQDFVMTFGFSVVSANAFNRDEILDSIRKLYINNQCLRSAVSVLGNGTPMQFSYSCSSDFTPVFSDVKPETLFKEVADIPFDLKKGGCAETYCSISDGTRLTVIIKVHSIFLSRLMIPLIVNDFYNILNGAEVSEDDSLRTFSLLQNNSETSPNKLMYWKDGYSDSIPVLDLPADRARPLVKAHIGAVLCHVFPDKLSEQIRVYAEKRGHSTFEFIFSATAALLYKYTGNNEMSVGTSAPFSAAPDGKAGIFLNIIPIKLSVSGSEEFDSLLTSLSDEFRKALIDKETPLADIINALTQSRNTSRNPLFDVVISENKYTNNNPTVQMLDNKVIHSSFDLDISVKCGETIIFEALFDEKLFNAKRIERFFSHLEKLINDVINGKELLISNIDIIPENERKLIEKCNSTEHPFPDDQTLVSVFEAQAMKTPDATALIEGDRSVTYSELLQLSSNVSAVLKQDTAGKYTCIMTERSVDMIAGIYGIIRTGKAYVPLNPDYPSQRTEWMLEDTNSPTVLTEKRYADKFDKHKSKLIFFNEIANGGMADDITSPEDSAYIIFTSGSTGRPKGVEISHKAIMNRLFWMQDTFRLDENDIILQKTPYSFDVSVWEIFWWSHCGASLAILPPGGEKDPQTMTDFIADKGCTVMHFVPSMLNHFLIYLETRPEEVEKLKTLRYVFVSGEALTAELSAKFQRIISNKVNTCLHNLYGPTEAAVDVTWQPCTPHNEALTQIPIGKPVYNTQIYILDKNGCEMPFGLDGEIYLGGVQLAKGYINRPELTAEKFVTIRGERLYKTGDKGRRNEDGSIEFYGRLDDQIKVRGFRIETGEVENALMKINGVKECAVNAVPGSYNTPELVAWIAADNNLDHSSIKESLGKTLPDYMIPSKYFKVATIPLNANGKADKKALLKENTPLNAPAPAGDMKGTEKAVADIWCGLLGIPEVASDSNFFDSGGNSLLLLRLHEMLDAKWKGVFRAADLFTYTTVKEISDEIDAKLKGCAQVEREPDVKELSKRALKGDKEAISLLKEMGVLKSGSAKTFQISKVQSSIWAWELFNPGTSVYHIPIVLDIPFDTTVEDVKKAFVILADRQHILKSSIVAAQGKGLLRVNDKLDLEVGEEFVKDKNSFYKLMESLFTAPLDISKSPLFNVTIITGTERVEKKLAIIFHHIIFDGWSFPIFKKEFMEILENGTDNNLPKLSVQYQDYSAAHNALLNSGKADKLKKFWQDSTSGYESFDMPYDFPRPAVKSSNGGIVMFNTPDDVSESVDNIIKRGNTAFAVFLSALNILFGKVCNIETVPIGVPSHGRFSERYYPLIGCFINMLPIITKVKPDMTVQELIKSSSANIFAALDHQEYPHSMLLDMVPEAKKDGRVPFLDIVINLSEDIDEVAELMEIQESKLGSRFDLNFYINRNIDKAWKIGIEFNSDLYTDETISLIAKRLFTVLSGMDTGYSNPVKDVNVISESELQVLKGLNPQSIEMPATNIIEQFDRAADINSDKVAIKLLPREQSYAELKNDSVKIASFLQNEMNVKAGEVICVVCDRIFEISAIYLGILRAGCVILPIDPDWPDERLDLIIKDTGCKAVITNRPPRQIAGADFIDYKYAYSDKPLKSPDIQPDTVAYILFTSGSTGTPKGVQISHNSLCSLIGSAHTVGLIPNGKYVQAASLVFDISMFGIFLPLLNGGSFTPTITPILSDVEGYTDIIIQNGCTDMIFSTGVLNVLVSGGNDVFKYIKRVMTGGEALNPETGIKMCELYPETTLINAYGPTETTVVSTTHIIDKTKNYKTVPIGRPVPNTRVYITDSYGNLLPKGSWGELCIAGDRLSGGYLNKPELTKNAFVPLADAGEERVYRTGDIARWNIDGELEFKGRQDGQVKIRGVRVEIGEIENTMLSVDFIRDCAVIKTEYSSGIAELSAFAVVSGDVTELMIKKSLEKIIPASHIPSRIMIVDKMPLNTSGKIDRQKLSKMADELLRSEKVSYISSGSSETAETIYKIFKSVLPENDIDFNSNFFDAGGNSTLTVDLFSRINDVFPDRIKITDLFRYTTVNEIASFLTGEKPESAVGCSERNNDDIAVVGMGVRVSDYSDTDSFWADLMYGCDKIGEIPPERKKQALDMIGSDGSDVSFYEIAYLDDISLFDPSRFGISPAEAVLMDSEQKLFMMISMAALDDAGAGGDFLKHKKVGVFAGASPSSVYRDFIIQKYPERVEQAFSVTVPSSTATRLSYLMDWKGPAAIVDTACSSSLNAVHLACRALQNGDCEYALAGGVKVSYFPVNQGVDFSIQSKSGRAYTFDDSAEGTGMGEGGCAVLLKPLTKALADGDRIHAVIKGSAVNQDGRSSGPAAPNPKAQTELILSAWADAGVTADSIGYIEAHGTGTKLGDPIEIDALTKAFSRQTDKKQFAAIGSVKGNFGHLDSAAGIIGLIKAILCLKNGKIPPQPFYTTPNREIDFENSPVFVPETLIDFPAVFPKKRCGVSSFGLSGVNCHIVLEEAPSQSSAESKGNGFFLLSAPDDELLREYSGRLALALVDTDLSLDDIAFTLAKGRSVLKKRIAIKTDNKNALIKALTSISAGVKFDEGAIIYDGVSEAGGEFEPIVEDFLQNGKISSDFKGKRVHLPYSKYKLISIWPKNTGIKKQIQKSEHFISEALETPEGFSFSLNTESHDFWPLHEHKLAGIPVMAGMAVISIIHHAAAQAGMKERIEIKNLQWLMPLRPADFASSKCLIKLDSKDGYYSFSLMSKMKSGEWGSLFTAEIFESDSPADKLDIKHWQKMCTSELEVDDIFENKFINISDKWRCAKIKRSNSSEDAFYGEFKQTVSKNEFWHNFNPALIDIVVSMGLKEGYIPASCSSVEVFGPLTQNVFAVVKINSGNGSKVLSADVELLDENGVVSVRFVGLSWLKLSASVVPLYKKLWKEKEIGNVADVKIPQKLIACGDKDILSRFAAELVENNAYIPENGSFDDSVLQTINASDGLRMVYFHNGQESLLSFISMLKTILKSAQKPVYFLLVTNGSFRIKNELLQSEYSKSSLFNGVIRAVVHESIILRAKSVDRDDKTTLKMILEEFNEFDNLVLPLTAYRNGKRYVRTIERAVETDGPELVENGGSYLITGGAGGIGSVFAGYLASKGAKAIGILSRNPKEILTKIDTNGTEIHYIKCDAADANQVDEAVRSFVAKTGSLTGVIHSAGVAGDGFLINKEDSVFELVLRPKVDATINLYNAVRQYSPEYMLICSSGTALTGAAGQTDYTAANLFQDFFAEQHSDDPIHVLSINWPLWTGTGMAAGLPAESINPNRISPESGPVLAEAALKTGVSGIVPVADVGFINALTQKKAEKQQSIQKKKQSLIDQIKEIWCSELDYDELNIDDDFYDIGGDSLSAMRIASRVSNELGMFVNVTNIFANPTIKDLTLFLGGDVNGEEKTKTIPKAPLAEFYPLISGQEDIFRFQQIAPESTTYNLPIFARFRNGVDEEKLKTALTKLFERHTVFKASFKEVSGEIRMYINDDRKLQFEIINIKDAKAGYEIAIDIIQPYKLDTDTLFRTKLLKDKENGDVLFIDMHHIIGDGQTIEILLDELKEIYFNGDVPPLETDTIDFICWMKSLETSAVWEQEKNFWLSKFPDGIKETIFPEDLARPSKLTFRGGAHSFKVDSDRLERIRTFAKKAKTTVYSFMTTALAIVLTRQIGRDDIVIFSASTLRDKKELENVPGLLINTVPLCIETNPDMSLGDNIKNVSSAIGDTLVYKMFGSGDIKKALGNSYSEDRFRFGEVFFSYMNYNQSQATTGEDSWVELLGTGDKAASKAELSFFGLEKPDKLHITLEYYADAYSEKYIQHLCALYDNLIDVMLDFSPETLVRDISEIPQDENEKLLNIFSGREIPFPKDESLASLFSKTAKMYPENIAIEDEQRRLSYRELDEISNYAAKIIKNAGAKDGAPIAVYADRSIDSVAAILGIIKAGCCYLPVDISAPLDRVGSIIKSGDCQIIISENDYPDVDVINVSLKDVVNGRAGEPLVSGSDGNSVAYVMFTSGSTGIPKGVAIKHQSVTRLVRNTDYIEFNSSDKILMGGTLAFDASTLEIWGALLNGGTLCIANRDRLLSSTGLKDMIQDYKITKMWLTSSLFNKQADSDPEAFRSLKVLITGGEKLSRKHVEKVINSCPELTLMNGYGPTENTTFTTTHVITREDMASSSIPIGRPIANTSVYILDSRHRLVPVGVWGDIATGGYGVGLGYVNDKELTEKVFIDNPYDEGKLYMTGDIGRFRADGVIEFAGRKDAQVKIRGNRVELTEVERVITDSGYVDRAAAFIEENESDKLLSLCLAGFDEGSIAELQKYLMKTVPTYMIPSRYYLVAEIPVNRNGKTERSLLPKCASEGRLITVSRGNSEELNDNEKMVLECFKKIMGIESLSIDDNFFSLGGHSLQAAKIIAAIQDRCGYEISISKFMMSPVVRDIAALIEDTVNTSEILKAKPADDYPLSFAQKRLYSVCQYEGASHAYNMNTIMKMAQSFDLEIFKKTVGILLERNEIFRTGFLERNGDIRQKVFENITPPITVEHLDKHGEQNIEKLIKIELDKTFDLSNPPLIRFHLWEHTDKTWTMCIVIHHIAGDGTSVEVMFRMLRETYEELSQGREPQYEKESINYKDFAVWQNSYDFTEALKSWKFKLKDVPSSVDLPHDYNLPAQRNFTGKTINRGFDKELSDKLHVIAVKLNISFNSLMLGIFALLVNKLSNQNDFCIALGTAARHHPALQQTIGFFVNLLPIRFRFNDNEGIEEFFTNTYYEVLAALDIQHCPFDLLVDEIQTSRVSNRQPLTNIGFEYEAFEFESKEQTSLEFLGVEKELGNIIFSDTSKFDATLFVIEQNSGLALRLEFDTELFSEESALRWLDYYNEFCMNIAEMLY